MAVMMRDLYSVLKESGASETAALNAAVEVGEFTKQVDEAKGEFSNIRSEFASVRTGLATIKGELRTIKAVLLLAAGGVVAIAIKTFFR